MALAADTGFNVIIVNSTGGGLATYRSDIIPVPPDRTNDPLADMITAAHARGVQVYAWVSYISGGAAEHKNAGPEQMQVLLPGEEDAALRKTRVHPDRADVMAGKWLCPDRGLNDGEARVTDEIMHRYKLDGLAIDFLGYRNYAACYCDYSRQKRAEFATAHPELSESDVLREFSTNSLVTYTRQIRERVLAARPQAKLAIHIYPDFDPDPLYGAKLPVEYCGQTIAWFYTPHWSFESIAKKHMAYMEAQKESGPDYNQHVPFVGARPGEVIKTPDRVRTEIRIAGLGGCRTFMFAFHESLTMQPELIQVLKEELSGGQ